MKEKIASKNKFWVKKVIYHKILLYLLRNQVRQVLSPGTIHMNQWIIQFFVSICFVGFNCSSSIWSSSQRIITSIVFFAFNLSRTINCKMPRYHCTSHLDKENTYLFETPLQHLFNQPAGLLHFHKLIAHPIRFSVIPLFHSITAYSLCDFFTFLFQLKQSCGFSTKPGVVIWSCWQFNWRLSWDWFC